MKRPARARAHVAPCGSPRRLTLGVGEDAFDLEGAFRRALRLVGAGASGVLLGCGGAADSLPLDHDGLPARTDAPRGEADGERGESPDGLPGGAEGEVPGAVVERPAFGPRTPRPAPPGTPSGDVVNDPGFELLPCAAGEYPEPLYLPGLSPAAPPDYLEMLWWSQRVRESMGELCGGALDAAACAAKFEAQEDESAMVIGQIVQAITTYALRGTRGDEPFHVGSLPELSAFLGDIDSLGDAALWVASHGYNLACGVSGGVARASGFDVLAFTQQGCDGSTRHLLHVAPDGTLSAVDAFVEAEPDPYCVVGRRPQGLAAPRVLRSSLGEFFAGCAELEAASVPAFVRLARELRAHGAPESLVWRALRSAREEVRHARVVGALARRFGATPRWPRCPVGRVRPLEQVAIENAVEGCVRETYGALVAEHQRRFAEDRAVARVYAGIAADETRHAALSWDVARWAERRLPRRSGRDVVRARQDAARSLTLGLASSRSKPIDAVAGLPAPSVGHALAESLGATLWRDGIG